jgi:transposase
MTMDHYAGIDVSLEASSVCVVDGAGKIVREAKIASEPDALIGWFASLGLDLARIGLEAGPLSQWLYAAMKEAGLAVELLETRHVRTALQTMPVKTDRNDARGIAQLMRLGWFRPVHCKSMAAQETRALLTARKLVQSKLYDIEMSLRGILRGFGLKVGLTTPKRFARRIEELVAGHATLEVIAKALLSAHAALLREFDMFEKRVRAMARQDKRVRLIMSARDFNIKNRVGPIVALTYVSAIDDPSRFSSSKRVGPHFGLTPRKYQSGETDVTGRITKIGDAGVRTALYEAANVILTRPVKGAGLKSWAMKLARRAGMKKAKVALARKLAVILHRMWVDGTAFDARKAAFAVVAAA